MDEKIIKEIRDIESQIEIVSKQMNSLVEDIQDPKKTNLSDEDQKKMKILANQREALDAKLMSIQSRLSLTDLMQLASMFANDPKN